MTGFSAPTGFGLNLTGGTTASCSTDGGTRPAKRRANRPVYVIRGWLRSAGARRSAFNPWWLGVRSRGGQWCAWACRGHAGRRCDSIVSHTLSTAGDNSEGMGSSRGRWQRDRSDPDPACGQPRLGQTCISRRWRPPARSRSQAGPQRQRQEQQHEPASDCGAGHDAGPPRTSHPAP